MVFANLEKSLDMLTEEGRQKGLEATALEMLRDKVNPQTIAKYTKLSLDRIHELTKRL